MRCPGCNKKQRKEELLSLGFCKKCGREHKMKDFFRKNWKCQLFDICNFADKCNDDDWKNCGTYQSFMGFIKDLKFGYEIETPSLIDYSALNPFRLKSGISGEMEMID